MCKNQNFEKPCLYLRHVPFRLSFSPFLIFLLQQLTFYLACFQFKNSRNSIIEAGNSYHGVVEFSWGKFCSMFFTQIWALVDISGSIDIINLIWVSKVRKTFSSCRIRVYIKYANFGQWRWCQKGSKGQCLLQSSTASTDVNGLI